MPGLRSSRIAVAATLVIATALWPWPASSQIDQAITRTQSNNMALIA
jgi:hypothetical protein